MIQPFISDTYAHLAGMLKETGFENCRCMIAGDSNTLPLYGAIVSESVKNVFSEIHTYAFPAGEEHKNLRSIEELLAHLVELRFDRHDCIMALGGGVAGDMAGFSAAIYLRGIRVVQLPTSLLAQIDSSIGGKTGVDFRGYKNMIGAFHMPSLVYANTAVLSTLPEEQFTAGMGEVIKTGILADKEFFSWIVSHRDEILGKDQDALKKMITHAAGIKTGIVERDPTERGERALLNLGHTIGHAIEKYFCFQMLHGCCVAAGTLAALAISRKRNLVTDSEAAEIRQAFSMYGLPVSVHIPDPDAVLDITKSDKKMRAGKIRFILPCGIGKAICADDVTEEELMLGIRAVSEQGGAAL